MVLISNLAPPCKKKPQRRMRFAVTTSGVQRLPQLRSIFEQHPLNFVKQLVKVVADMLDRPK